MKSSTVKDFFRSQYFIVTLITVLALFLRLLNLDKPSGLWYDEMITYIFSSESFPFGILKMLWHQDFHMPLYYMFVHVWMKLFGSADVTLRLSSVFWGVLTIPAFFYLGKTYKSKNLGYLLAIIGCLSPVLIYYSQEFRFYSMLAFFSTISITYFIKLIDDSTIKNYLFFFISNLIILYIYTMGIIFVGIETFLLLVHFYLYKKNAFLNMLKNSVIFFVLSIPYFILLFSYIQGSNNSLVDPLVDAAPKPYSLLILFNTLCGTFLKNISSQDGFNTYQILFNNPVTRIILIFMSSATVCFSIGFASSFRELNNKIIYLVLILFSFLGVELFLCYQQSFAMTARYAIIILPVIFLVSCNGLLLIKSKKIRNFLIGLIILVFVSNSINYKKSPSFSDRASFIKYAATELNKLKLDKNDYVLYPNDTELLKKYINNVQFIYFDIPATLYLDKTKQERSKVFDKEFIESTNKKNAPGKLIPYILSAKPTNELKSFLDTSIEKIPKGNKLILFGFNGVGNIKNAQAYVKFLSSDMNNEAFKQKYNESLLSFLYIKINADIKNVLENNPQLTNINSITKDKTWSIDIYEKLK